MTVAPHHPQKQQTSDSLTRPAKGCFNLTKNETQSFLHVSQPAPSSPLLFLRLHTIAVIDTGNLGSSEPEYIPPWMLEGAGKEERTGEKERGRTGPWWDHLCFSSSSAPHHSQSLFPKDLPDLLESYDSLTYGERDIGPNAGELVKGVW